MEGPEVAGAGAVWVSWCGSRQGKRRAGTGVGGPLGEVGSRDAPKSGRNLEEN